ncbi:DinB family protein [Chitinophaga sedimenti]|uniref:DinB family protein n=1 Tax=Chitinophaga sedimenti TaxID=2033606 RepID=UPI0020032C98|nr:DinB family protein [Chitinophaga sedimenti]MCK7560198.1 DinB family protein [Chitinophaga sedimenti]
MAKPVEGEFNPYAGTYINYVPEDDVVTALAANTRIMIDFFRSIPVDKRDYAYAPGKWTIKQVLQHVTDAERIFAYRALRFARADKTELPGWEENEYGEQARVDHLQWDDMLDEFIVVRKSSEYLFKSLNEAELQRGGIANGRFNTVNSIGFVIAGHAYHHHKITQERYL